MYIFNGKNIYIYNVVKSKRRHWFCCNSEFHALWPLSDRLLLLDKIAFAIVCDDKIFL